MCEGDGAGVSWGPVVNRLANEGNPKAFTFSKPHILGYDYSFSGLKTSFLYTLRDKLQEEPDFIEKNKQDLCASLQATVIDILMNKLRRAAKDLGIKEVAVAGGVSANSGLRVHFLTMQKRLAGRCIPEILFHDGQCGNGCHNGVLQISRQAILPDGCGSLCKGRGETKVTCWSFHGHETKVSPA